MGELKLYAMKAGFDEVRRNAEGVTQAKANLVRACKTGVKPSAISRQFGISQALIRQVLQAGANGPHITLLRPSPDYANTKVEIGHGSVMSDCLHCESNQLV